VIEKFFGKRNIQTVNKFKEKILALTRVNHVEKFLFQSVEDLLPVSSKYKKDDAAEQRKYDEDCEKITDKAAEA
jgi:predicted Ser/Thr protein kinase